MIRQRCDLLKYGDCRSHATQNAILPFFENSLKCVCFCPIISIFDYHCAQILCELEEQAKYMPMSPSFLGNSGFKYSGWQWHHNRISKFQIRSIQIINLQLPDLGLPLPSTVYLIGPTWGSLVGAFMLSYVLLAFRVGAI